MSTFSGLNTATTALWAQRRGLDVTGQNIANVNTEGYSRQRVDLQAMGGTGMPAFYSVSNGTNGGVEVAGVVRIRDSFLEGRAHTEYATQARLTVQNDAYEQIQQAVREPGDTGIQSQLSDMWAAWGDVANHPTDIPARSQLLQRTQTLASGIAAARSALDGQWAQTRESLGALVDDVNATAADIAKLNDSIRRATQDGKSANELTDQRDVLVLKLAGQVGATVRPAENGVVNVLVGGVTLVAGGTATRLATQGAVNPDDVATDAPRIVTVPGGTNVTPGGTAEGQIDVLTRVVPDYRTGLDAVSQDLVTRVNALHRHSGAEGAPGSYDLTGAPAGDLLTFDAATGEITLAFTDPAKVAASRQAPEYNTPGDPTSGVKTPAADAGVADAIAQLRIETGGADMRYRGMIVELGIQAAVVERNLGIQSVITTNVDAARESVAGVNLDEEMSNMLQFQHAYSAAARMVTAIDEALDVLINRTGVVGR
ncbi:flagellar hook-associated protein FlgK [Geodermatophilus sp. SYSU D00079]